MNISFINKLFSRGNKAITTVATEVLEKEVPKTIKYLKPSETLAFATKPLANDAFCKIANKNSRLVILDTEAGKATGNLKQYSDEVLDRLTDKREYSQIEKSIRERNAKELEQKTANALNHFKMGYMKFSETGITNPDEIMKLITSGKYDRGENEMLETLCKTGNAKHAEQIMPDIEQLTYKIPKETEDFRRSDLRWNLAAKIKTVGLIGDEKQQAELIKNLKIELKGNHDKDVVGGIFKGLGDIGTHQPDNKKYAKILLEQLETTNKKKVYEYLSSFNGQYKTLLNGLLENPKNSDILIAAYKGAKTTAQKNTLLNEILASEELTNTAICSSSKIYTNKEHKAFKADILSEIMTKKFDTLTIFQQSCLKDDLKIAN